MNDNAKVNIFRTPKFYITTVSVLVVILVGTYMAGFRLLSNFSVGKVGFLEMTLPLPQTSIFIDESEKITTTKDNESVKIKFSPKQHSVIVSRDGYFPWKKDFDIPSGGVVLLYPMFVSMNPSGNIVTNKDPDYWKIINQINQNKAPTKSNPKISEDQTTKIWLENNTIYSQKTGEDAKIVVETENPIRNIEFYKNRNDSIMFSTLNTVYAIEINKEGSQNFMPIYKGQNPSFIETNPSYIYIDDVNVLMQVII